MLARARECFGREIPALIGLPKRSAPWFNLKDVLSRYVDAGTGFSQWERFPLVGEERGDRAEIERIMVGTFALTVGAPTIVTREFPVGDPWLDMRINLRGQLLGGGVAPAGTIVADAPLPLWQLALTTDLDRDIIEPTLPARGAYRYAQFLNGTADDIVAPVLPGIGATIDFNVAVHIPFVDERLVVPMDSVLDTRRYNAITLTVTSGVLGDIVTGAANLTLQALNADIQILRVSPRVPLPLNIAKVVPFYKRFASQTPAADTFTNLDRIPTLAMKRLAFFASTGATAGVPMTGTGSDAILDTIRVSSNIRDHFGSPSGGISRRTIRGANKSDYGIETWPTGWYVADFVLDGSLLSALATGDLSVLQSIYTYQAGLPATPQVTVMLSGVQKLRGTEAV